MTDTTRYVNTESTAGGDGTTNAVEGDNRAYATLTEAEAALQGTVNSGDRVLIQCCGETAETAVVTFAGWTNNGEVHIIANRDDEKGFCSDPEKGYSTGHYRIEVSSGSYRCLYINNDGNFTVNGIQAYNSVSNSYDTVDLGAATNGKTKTCINCRLKAVISTGKQCISGAYKTGTFVINNNILNTGAAGISFSGTASYTGTGYVYNNVIYNCANGFSGDLNSVTCTTNIYNNAVSLTSAAAQIILFTEATQHTLYNDYNAYISNTETHGVIVTAWSEQWEESTAGNFQLKSTSTLRNAGLDDAYGPSTDMLGNSWTSGQDIGVFDYGVAFVTTSINGTGSVTINGTVYRLDIFSVYGSGQISVLGTASQLEEYSVYGSGEISLLGTAYQIEIDDIQSYGQIITNGIGGLETGLLTIVEILGNGYATFNGSYLISKENYPPTEGSINTGGDISWNKLNTEEVSGAIVLDGTAGSIKEGANEQIGSGAIEINSNTLKIIEKISLGSGEIDFSGQSGLVDFNNVDRPSGRYGLSDPDTATSGTKDHHIRSTGDKRTNRFYRGRR